jgi:protein-tyrosine phosphatase
MTQVFDRVFLGDNVDASNPWLLKHLNISHVLNVTDTLRNYFDNQTTVQVKIFKKKGDAVPTPVIEEVETIDSTPLDAETTPTEDVKQKKKREFEMATVEFEKPILYKRISIRDSMEDDLKQYFEEGISFIQNSIQDASGACLVHCREARSRSVSIIIAYAMKKLEWSLSKAFNHVHELRQQQTRINDGFKRQLMAYELELLQLKIVGDETVENSIDFFQQEKRRKPVVVFEPELIVKKKYKKKKKPKPTPTPVEKISPMKEFIKAKNVNGMDSMLGLLQCMAKQPVIVPVVQKEPMLIPQKQNSLNSKELMPFIPKNNPSPQRNAWNTYTGGIVKPLMHQQSSPSPGKDVELEKISASPQKIVQIEPVTVPQPIEKQIVVHPPQRVDVPVNTPPQVEQHTPQPKWNIPTKTNTPQFHIDSIVNVSSTAKQRFTKQKPNNSVPVTGWTTQQVPQQYIPQQQFNQTPVLPQQPMHGPIWVLPPPPPPQQVWNNAWNVEQVPINNLYSIDSQMPHYGSILQDLEGLQYFTGSPPLKKRTITLETTPPKRRKSEGNTSAFTPVKQPFFQDYPAIQVQSPMQAQVVSSSVPLTKQKPKKSPPPRDTWTWHGFSDSNY